MKLTKRTNLTKLVAAGLVAATLHGSVAHATPPPATNAQRIAQLQARRAQLQSLLDRLNDANGMTARDAQDLLRAYQEFHHEVARGDFNLGEAGLGLGVGTLGNLLAGEGLGLAGGLWGLAIAAYLQVIGDGLHNAALINMAIDNTAFYGWIVDAVHNNRVGAIDDRVERWFHEHRNLLHRITGVAPPRMHTRTGIFGWDWIVPDSYDRTEIRNYLRTHAVRILFFLGMLEETHGPAAFPRYIFASTDPILRRNQWRTILRPVIQRELQAILGEIDRVLNANRTSSAAPVRGDGTAVASTSASDVGSVLGLTGAGATPAGATVDGAPGTPGANVAPWALTAGGVLAAGSDAGAPAAAGAGIERF